MERLIRLMTDRKVTNYGLAKSLNIVEGTVRKWKKGETIPRGKTLEKLAAYFHVHPAWLLYGDAQYAPTLENDAMIAVEEIVQYGPEALKWVRDNLRFLYGRGQTNKQPVTVQAAPQKAHRHRTA